ncbi:bifunctional metallophosphatase/5'-nucleotidase [Thermodesulfobacteriota bacterium]
MIYVDLDDVISETTCHYVKILEHEFGKSVAFEEITSFNLKESFSLTSREYEYFFELVHKPEIILGLELVEGVIDVLHKWKNRGYEISVVTGRLTSTYESSLEWLKSNKIPFDFFHMVDKYSRNGVDKNIAMSLESFSQIEFAVAVEDSVEMASFLSRVMNRKVILFDRPWNRSVLHDNHISRCMSWYEIGKIDMERQE